MTATDTAKINERELVLDILLLVTRDGVHSHIALGEVLDKYQYLEKKSRAFISRLSQGTLERMIELDAVISITSARRDALNSTGSVTSWNSTANENAMIPSSINMLPVRLENNSPIKISGHANVDPIFATGTMALRRLSGT